MAHIVIVGAGIAGLLCARELRAKLDAIHAITLINSTDQFIYTPALNCFSIAWREIDDITFSLSEALTGENINFLAIEAHSIALDSQEIQLSDKSVVPFDYLVLATGAVEQQMLASSTQSFSNYSVGNAQALKEHYQHFVTRHFDANQGVDKQAVAQQSICEVVVSALQPTSHIVKAYELIFLLDADLRRRSLRENVKLTLLTHESEPGELGLSGVGDSIQLIKTALKQRDINVFCAINSYRYQAEKLYIVKGESTDDQRDITFHAPFHMDFPALKAADFLIKTQLLTDENGNLSIDKTCRTKASQRVYAIGDCVALEHGSEHEFYALKPSELLCESMVNAVTQNICSDINNTSSDVKFKTNAIGLIQMGREAAAYAAIPYTTPRSTSYFEIEEWLHYAKQRYDKQFLERLRGGEKTTSRIKDKR